MKGTQVIKPVKAFPLHVNSEICVVFIKDNTLSLLMEINERSNREESNAWAMSFHNLPCLDLENVNVF